MYRNAFWHECDLFLAPSVYLCLTTVCTAASLKQPNEELCQSSGQHGRCGKSFICKIIILLLLKSVDLHTTPPVQQCVCVPHLGTYMTRIFTAQV